QMIVRKTCVIHRVGCTAAMVLFALACTQPTARAPEPAPAGSSPVAAAPATAAVASPVAPSPATRPAATTKLVFGGAVTPPSMVHLPPYVAKQMGFFDEVGLDVEIIS